MKTLNLQDSLYVSGGGNIWGEAITSMSFAVIGAAMASKYLAGVNVYWLGVIPAPIVVCGGIASAAIGHLIYDLDSLVIMP